MSRVEREDHFDIMSPVSGNKITGRTAAPHFGIVPNFVTNNQASSSQIMMAFDTDKRNDEEVGMYTYDTAKNVWGKRVAFPRRFLFQNGFPIYAAIDPRRRRR